ncbi:MAG: nickel-dependent lactate racemase [Bryobacteraceae bacterium]
MSASSTMAIMQVDLAFEESGLTLDLPEGFRYCILEERTAKPLADWRAALETALDEPIGTKPIQELARDKNSAAISVCDITRPAPNEKVLPPLLRRLEAAGIPRNGITILIATGLHRAATDEEVRKICGEEVASKYKIVNHDARDLSSHRHLGSTESGTPVYIDERFMAADLHLSLGFIEPHLMLGYSGGRKLVAPGLAAQETIKVLHSPKFMRDDRTKEGSIEDNPLHEELLEIARMARHDFIVDVALAEGRAIAGVFAGDPERAHRVGYEFISRVMLQQLPEPVDAVITSAAGYPLDLTFYQSIKGVTAASHLVKDGGRILLVGACSEGVGGPEFGQMLSEGLSDSEFLRSIETTPVIPDQWQLEKLAMVTTRKQVLWFVPGLPMEYQRNLWGKSFQSVKAAVSALVAGLPSGAQIAVIPDGPYVLGKAAVEPVGAGSVRDR